MMYYSSASEDTTRSDSFNAILSSNISFEPTRETGRPTLQTSDLIHNRYKLVDFLGSGESGSVWSAEDTGHGSTGIVAIKVMHIKGRMPQIYRARHAAKLIRSSNSPDTRLFSVAIATAAHLHHRCIVSRLHGMTLRDLLNRPRMLPLPANNVLCITKQIFKAIAFLRTINIAHTDVKPENIVLVEDTIVRIREMGTTGEFSDKLIFRSCEIKVIDFEEAQYSPAGRRHVAGSPPYRAPEIYTGTGWSYPIDVFAAGCVTFELYTGQALLPHSNDMVDVFLSLEATIGNFNPKFAKEIGRHHPKLFVWQATPKVQYDQKDRPADHATFIHLNHIKTLMTLFRDPLLKEFVKLTTNPNPRHRISAENALEHQVFRDRHPD